MPSGATPAAAAAPRNIAAHYDLSNEFFRLFLDDNLMYSCAVFPRPDSSLEEASRCKVDRICRKLALAPGDHLLEIGTGWGGFALHAAGEYGCRVTTATISQEQHDLTRQRVKEAGLDGRVEVVLSDYRDLRGRYDKLVSIESDRSGWPPLLRHLLRLLLPPAEAGGADAAAGHRHRRPGLRAGAPLRRLHQGLHLPGQLHPVRVEVINRSLAAATDMRLVHLEDIGPHYARTLGEWRCRFLAAEKQVLQLGFSREFIRMWDFYLSYCIGGFEERHISDVQMLLAKPGNRRPAQLPEIGHGLV